MNVQTQKCIALAAALDLLYKALPAGEVRFTKETNDNNNSPGSHLGSSAWGAFVRVKSESGISPIKTDECS